MAARLTVARMLAAPEQWNRRKLQVLLGVGALVVLAVLVGIVWSVTALLARDGDADSTADVNTGGDALVTIDANDAALEDAQPGPLATSRTGTIRVPQPTKLGENQVATGFPPTFEGAMAQLIAIDQRAIQSVSVVAAQDVIGSWAEPGGPTAESWSGVEAVRTLLESAGLPASGSTEMAVELRPAMGFILTAQLRAVTPCVDFVLTVTVAGAESSRIAVADCQHMLWSDGHWVIAPGEEPDPSASLWPGTQASYDAGYQWLQVLP